MRKREEVAEEEEWRPLEGRRRAYLRAGRRASRRVHLALLARADGGQGREVGVPLSHLSQLLLLHLEGGAPGERERRFTSSTSLWTPRTVITTPPPPPSPLLIISYLMASSITSTGSQLPANTQR